MLGGGGMMKAVQGIFFPVIEHFERVSEPFCFPRITRRRDVAGVRGQESVTSADNSAPPKFHSFDCCSQKYLILGHFCLGTCVWNVIRA